MLTDNPTAPRVEQDVEAMLLHAAYDRLPLSLQMTAAVTFIFAGLLWSFFPNARMMAWVLAILAVVAVRYLLWASFKRAKPESDALLRWRRLFLVGSAAAGAAWALGPILMMPQAGSPASALFVGTLLSVCAVAITTQGSQQAAMLAFVITALVPSAIAIWGTGGDVERVTAVVLMAGLVSLIVVGRRSSKAMREVLETQFRIRAILNTAMDAVIGMDAQGQITDWNLRAETIFGWSKDEALGLTFHDTIFPEQNQEVHRQGLIRSLATGEDRFLNRRIETTAMRRDGEEFPIELAITQLRTGDTWHFTAFIADITERKRSEKALERTRMGLRQIIDLIPEMLWLKDADGRFLMVNQANARNYNMSVDALTGRLHSEIHSDKDELAKMLLDDRRVIETGVPIFIPEGIKIGTPVSMT
ncbi:MAG: PAS domain S-box protein, partial [Deltaproteobacteria bacterium]